MKSLIFAINITHQYYQQSFESTDNYSNEYPLMLVPDERTERFIQRYQLLRLQTDGYFALYHMGPGPGEHFAQALATLLEDQPMVLYVQSRDPDFITVSDVPVNWYGLMAYSSNQVGESVGAAEAVPMQQTLEGPVSPMTGKAGNKVGKVSIYPQSLSQNRQYQIAIAARQTHWHYYVFNRSQLHFNELLITNRQGLAFTNAGEVTLQNGEQATLFKSPGSPLPLQGSKQTHFDLLNLLSGGTTGEANAQANSNVLIKGLPIPPTNRIDVTELNGQPYVYSQMYVYL